MFDIKRKIAVAAMLGMMAIVPLQTASAGSYGDNSGLHIGYGYNGGHLSYGHNRGHKRYYDGKHSNGHSNYGHSNRGHNKYVGNHSGYSGAYNCRDTYKHQTDHNGKLTKINGTLCYDSYGKAYIVPGSRYVDSTYH